MAKLTVEEPQDLKTALENTTDLFQSVAEEEEILSLYDSGVKTAVGINRLTGLGTKKINGVLKQHREEYSKYCAHLTGKTPTEHIDYKKELISVLENRIKSILSQHELELYKGLIRKD